MVDRLGVRLGELERRVLERGVRGDQVDRLPLDDLVAEHVHQAATLQAGTHAAGRFARLGSDRPDLLVVVGGRVGDPLVLGDPLEDEVLLQGPGRACHHALAEFVDVPPDRVVVEAAAAEFEDRPLQFPLRLPPQQRWGQIPRGGGGQRVGHLLPHLLAAVPLELAFQLLPHGGLEGVGRLESAELVEEGGRHLGKLETLHVEDGEFHGHVLAADVFDRRLVGHLHGGGDGCAGLGLRDELREARQFGIGEREPVADDDLGLVGLGQHAVAVLEHQLGDD